MNVAAQASLFEPEGEEAVRLLDKWMRDADRHAAAADRCEMLGLTGAVRVHDALMHAAAQNALVFAVLLDLEREAAL